jgi:hypothetical protein
MEAKLIEETWGQTGRFLISVMWLEKSREGGDGGIPPFRKTPRKDGARHKVVVDKQTTSGYSPVPS